MTKYGQQIHVLFVGMHSNQVCNLYYFIIKFHLQPKINTNVNTEAPVCGVMSCLAF